MTKSRIVEHSAPSVGTLRRRALDAARILLEQGGPEALHLRTIAAKIGCGAASLYYHFTGKDALLGALAMEGFQELRQAMTKVVQSREFVRDIDSASAGYLRFMGQNLQLYALMYSEHILANNEAVRDVERHVLEVFQDALRSDDRVPADKIEEASLAYSAFGRGIAAVILSQGNLAPEATRLLGQKIVSGFGVLLQTQFLTADQARRE